MRPEAGSPGGSLCWFRNEAIRLDWGRSEKEAVKRSPGEAEDGLRWERLELQMPLRQRLSVGRYCPGASLDI